jgi:hypothetical protein
LLDRQLLLAQIDPAPVRAACSIIAAPGRCHAVQKARKRRLQCGDEAISAYMSARVVRATAAPRSPLYTRLTGTTSLLSHASLLATQPPTYTTY